MEHRLERHPSATIASAAICAAELDAVVRELQEVLRGVRERLS
jgi:hypothetical protein